MKRMLSRNPRIFPWLFVLLLSTPLTAAPELPIHIDLSLPSTSYDPGIPTPETVIGYTIGERHTEPHQIVRFFDKIAAASPRVTVQRHGATYENRPLIHAIVTSAENHGRLEDIRRENLRISETPADISDDHLSSQPVVLYLGYSIHGNEASGSEAAMLTLYHLAAGESEEIEEILSRCIVIIDPMLNPDGRLRFTGWVNGNRGGVANGDPADREHVEPWPGGRTNHFWFDMNRDWLPGELRESRARLDLFHSWRPQLLTDHHEMGSSSTFFFQPGVPSRNNPRTPDRNYELTEQIAEFHADYLDRQDSLYYSGETFDDFYFGKGSTYPDINGSVGILFEQASSRALLREVRDGERLTYPFTIRNHFLTSLSTLQAAVQLRPELLRHQRSFYLRALESQPESSAILLSREVDGDRVVSFVNTLLRHRIRVHRLKEDRTIGDTLYRAEESFVVPRVQPQGRLLEALLEKVTDFNDSAFYDVSTWTLPLAYDLQPASIREPLSEILGDEILESLTLRGRRVGGEAGYAYLLPWGSYAAARALFQVQDAGTPTRLLTQPIEIEIEGSRKRFDRGTIVIPTERATAGIHEQVRQLAENSPSEFWSSDTGRTSDGPDLGSPSARPLRKPEIGLISGAGTRAYEVGEVWFLLTERLQIPVSLLDLPRVDEIDLDRYNTLVMVSGDYEDLQEEFIGRLQTWIEQGNVLIATRGAATWLAGLEFVEEGLREAPASTESVDYAEVARMKRAQTIPGTIFEVELDETHPLAFGVRRTIPVFRNHENFFEVSKVPGATVGTYSGSPLLSGYISEERLQQLSGTAAIIGKEIGDGAVILFADDPVFRGFWHGTARLFLNALFFGTSF